MTSRRVRTQPLAGGAGLVAIRGRRSDTRCHGCARCPAAVTGESTVVDIAGRVVAPAISIVPVDADFDAAAAADFTAIKRAHSDQWALYPFGRHAAGKLVCWTGRRQRIGRAVSAPGRRPSPPSTANRRQNADGHQRGALRRQDADRDQSCPDHEPFVSAARAPDRCGPAQAERPRDSPPAACGRTERKTAALGYERRFARMHSLRRLPSSLRDVQIRIRWRDSCRRR